MSIERGSIEVAKIGQDDNVTQKVVERDSVEWCLQWGDMTLAASNGVERGTMSYFMEE